MKLIHKRALSLLLSTALVLTALPVTAMALTLKDGVSYLDSNGGHPSANGVEVISSGFREMSDGWYLVDSGDVTIDHTLPVVGDANLILADGANLTVNGTSGDHAGIEVQQGCSLSIYAQSTGSSMGRLTATGHGSGAGIGSDSSSPSGNITICGGRITATGGSGSLRAPGIGNVSAIGFGTIAIYGGMVTATNGFTTANAYPDIGGCSDDGDEILIRGGTIVSGRSDPSVNLGVNGNGYIGKFPKVVIDGGSIHHGWIGASSLTDSHERPISQNYDELTVPGQINAAVFSVSIGGERYGNGVYTDGSGKLYLNLPAYNSILPVVVTMNDRSEYWAAYEPGSGNSITLVNAAETSVFPGTAVFAKYYPQDITVYKFDPTGNAFSGICNGATHLSPGSDYTVDGDTVIIKKEYLEKLPAGVASLTFSGLNAANSVLTVAVVTTPEYVALGDSIATGYGLDGYNPHAGIPPAGSYAQRVGSTLGLTTGSLAIDGLTSALLLEELSDPQAKAYLANAKVLTLSIGGDDILLPFLELVANKLNCDPSQIPGVLALTELSMPQNLIPLNADDGSGLKNNPTLNEAASRFAKNFQDIISVIKTAAPNAKIYVTNVYNPYEELSIGSGPDTLNFGEIANGYIQTLNSAFSSSSPDYTLIDTYSAFSDSLNSGTSLVNASLGESNFDPHPNAKGHEKIADMITEAYSEIRPAITTSSLPGVTQYVKYDQTLAAAGSSPITWSIASGALPDGLTLDPDSGRISGIPSSSGAFNFVAKAKNAAGADTRALSITVNKLKGMTISDVTGVIINLSPVTPPAAVSGAVAQVLSLPPSEQAQLPTSQVAVLEGLMQNTLHVAVPTISAPDTTGFSGSAALQGTPTAIGLTLATYGATGAKLTTIQQQPPANMPGAQLAFDLALTETGSSQQIHFVLPYPVTVTIPLPPSFFPQAGFHYTIKHTLHNGASELLPAIISGTIGHYTATFTTSSFSLFTLVETANGSGSDSHNSSSVSVPNPGVTGSTFVSDTNADFSVNGAYQFKITSQNGIAPLLTVGTPGVFETQLVRVSGNDYYFQLISIGKAGEKAGVYVNGGKLLVATVGTYVKSDTTALFQVKKGKTYTFKLTADEKPSFVCGNSSVFQVKFLRQSEKDYFYQVTAVGKPGQAAGFYLNAAKKPVAVAAVA